MEIIGQLRFLLLSLCLGMGVMAGYDMLRLFRWLLPHGRLWIWTEDMLYWFFSAFPVFFLFFHFNKGIIRWYGILSVAGGMLLYNFGISHVLRRWGNAFFLPKKQKLLRLFSKKGRKRMFCADCTKKQKKTKKHCKTEGNRL